MVSGAVADGDVCCSFAFAFSPCSNAFAESDEVDELDPPPNAFKNDPAPPDADEGEGDDASFFHFGTGFDTPLFTVAGGLLNP
eukprot:CAMPEP_0116056034 /NCGR_PEP_ID=MMETSP0322-20121206/3783_1 /TAXON_ID=163516 /ORGANISM="Leptocylindrus danicus var. apora, Strain B651" /LENGTH=82 /DNA_ID=CAMNT_0003539793 /DNA_START=118 /DNA_END=366 /DNA_ORIENTATION=+